MSRRVARALTIAGSDSGGGAGIQADLKSFAALRVYGMSAITLVTVQNSITVARVHILPPELVAAQIDAVASDLGVDAAKTGALGNSAVIEAVAERVEANGIERLVVDPVMISKHGAPLLADEARQTLIERLLPIASVITPNLPEAEVLAGMKIEDQAGMREAAERIAALGPRAVLVKGGHLGGSESVDVLRLSDGSVHLLGQPRIQTTSTHGTGCTLSAALAAGLARGWSVLEAARRAKEYVTTALRDAPGLGQGTGPLAHHSLAERAA